MFSRISSPSKGRRVSRAFSTVASVLAIGGLLFVATLTPAVQSFADPDYLDSGTHADQGVDALEGEGYSAEQESFTVASPTPTPEPEPVAAASSSDYSIPSAPAADPGSAQAIALDMVLARGWGQDQYSCLYNLWQRESGWNVYAHNASSGAYGIPQSLPGSKMETHGSDWQTNPATQIAWGLDYIAGRYGTPCGAWGHSESVGWY